MCASDLPEVSREVPIGPRPEFVGAQPVVREQSVAGEQPVISNHPVEQNQSRVNVVPVRQEATQSTEVAQGPVRQIDGSQLPEQEALQTVNRSVSQQRPVINYSPVVQQTPQREPATGPVSGQPNASVIQQTEPAVARPEAPPVSTGSTPADTETQTADGPEFRIPTSAPASDGQASTSGEERSFQRSVVNSPVVERTGNQPTFVMPETEVVQILEQPAQPVDVQTSDLDVEIMSVERPSTRVDVTSGSSRTAPEAGSAMDLDAEQIDRTYRVSEQIIRSARVLNRDGATQVTLRLDPPELGEVSIRLSSIQNGVVSGEIAVESQKVQEIVQRNMGALRESLAEQGIQIDQINVSVEDRGSSLTDREAFREALEDRRDNARSNTDRERPQTQQDMPEETPAQTPDADDGSVNFIA